MTGSSVGKPRAFRKTIAFLSRCWRNRPSPCSHGRHALGTRPGDERLSPGGGAGGRGLRDDHAGGVRVGRNPAVLTVTTLNDDGTGSLRAALESDRPRVIVFETSGNIDLQEDIIVREPCVTLAGQTAPSRASRSGTSGFSGTPTTC